MRTRPENCFKCGKDIEWSEHSPSGAVAFTTHGNYGSKTFDSTSEFLYGVICDECITVSGMHLRVQDKLPVKAKYQDLGSYTEWDEALIKRYKAVGEAMRGSEK